MSKNSKVGKMSREFLLQIPSILIIIFIINLFPCDSVNKTTGQPLFHGLIFTNKIVHNLQPQCK